ncbi:MAG: hypothetical protein EOP34_08380 [Rickettsiales bacterium]|nr:MAG: hypothetical protein EOP34_08380 [Rickettsiales bacterium]
MDIQLKEFDIKQRLFLLLACVLPASIALIFIILYAYNIPFADSWELVPLLKKLYAHENISLGDLAAQHNEHRILFPTIIMLGLAYLSDWNAIYEIYFSFGLLCISFCIIIIQVRRLYNVAANSVSYFYVFIATCLLVSLIIFAITQYENMLWGWQIQIFLNTLAILLGMLWLTNNETLNAKSIALAASCGIIATYSFANGILFWPIGGLVLLIRRRQMHNSMYLLTTWTLVALLVGFLYMHNYVKPSGHPPLTYILHNPSAYLVFLLSYLGYPMAELRIAEHIPVALWGAAGLLSVLVICYCLFKLKILWNRQIIFWHGLLVYTLLRGVITAVGRAGFGIEKALASRYITICNFFWLWIFVLGIYVYAKQYYFNIKKVYAVCAAMTLLFAYYTQAGFRGEPIRYKHLQQAQQSLMNDGTPVKNLYYIYPDSGIVLRRNAFLKKNNLSFYSK